MLFNCLQEYLMRLLPEVIVEQALFDIFGLSPTTCFLLLSVFKLRYLTDRYESSIDLFI